MPAFLSADEPAPKHVALVFDDGPVPASSAKLLALFADEGIHVTFSLVASKALEQPDAARAVRDAGHEIANHSYDHRPIGEIDEAAVRHDIVEAQAALTGILGAAPRWYWPPYLAVDDRVRAITAECGLTVYPTPHLVSSDDWNTETSAAQLTTNATTGVRDATVILFHEWREETYQQLPAILAELRRQGCVFLTFSELAAYAATLEGNARPGTATYGK